MSVGAIHVGQIDVIGIEGIEEILDIHIHAEADSHASVFIKVMMTQKAVQELLFQAAAEKRIGLASGEDVIFNGLISKISFEQSDSWHIAEIHGISGSVCLEGQKKCRSFQNTAYTGRDVIKEVLKDTEGAAAVFRLPKERLAQPLIQYQETDWEFILRVASLYHSSVYVDFRVGKPWIYCGLPKLGVKTGADILSLSWGMEEGQPCRRIETYCPCRLGEQIPEQDGFYIQALDGRLKNGLLVYSCMLRPLSCSGRQPVSNSKIKGISIKGTVIDVGEGCVRLWLDMDIRQEVWEAYWYEWQPETGNIFYCMPEVGARAYLHIWGKDESRAAATECLHTCYRGSQDRQNPANRSLLLAAREKIELFPQMLHFSGGGKKESDIYMEDQEGIQLGSLGEVTLHAAESIGLKGENIFLQAPEEVSIVRKSIMHPAVIHMGNRFDVSGKYTEMYTEGLPMEDFPIIRGEEGEYSLEGMELAVLASAPVDGEGMEDIIGRLAVGCRVHWAGRGSGKDINSL